MDNGNMKFEEIKVGKFYFIDTPTFGTLKFKCVEELLLVDAVKFEPTGEISYKFISKNVYGKMEIDIDKQESIDFWNLRPYTKSKK